MTVLSKELTFFTSDSFNSVGGTFRGLNDETGELQCPKTKSEIGTNREQGNYHWWVVTKSGTIIDNSPCGRSPEDLMCDIVIAKQDKSRPFYMEFSDQEYVRKITKDCVKRTDEWLEREGHTIEVLDRVYKNKQFAPRSCYLNALATWMNTPDSRMVCGAFGYYTKHKGAVCLIWGE
jgi:hypothetical protein